MLTFQLYFMAFFIAVIASRAISGRALKHLSSDQKASLVDAFSGVRVYALIPLAVIMGAYFVLIQYPVMSLRMLTVLYLCAFAIYIGWSFWFTRRRLLKLDLPKPYLIQIGIARAVRLASLAVLLLAVLSLGII